MKTALVCKLKGTPASCAQQMPVQDSVERRAPNRKDGK